MVSPAWAAANIRDEHQPDTDQACRDFVASLGAGGWLRYAVGGTAYGGQLTAGASPLQARAFDLGQNYGTDAAGLARSSAIADILSGKPAWQNIAADPYAKEYFGAVEAPSLLNFKQNIIPQILQAYGAGGPTGAVVSGRVPSDWT